ncbi:MAG: hypothetical protein J5I65_15595 [Aridibacter famidurans]|nr:hypothetical protein [Aridibacter famidurans]
MQHLPKNGGKKKGSNADDDEPCSKDESGRTGEDPKPTGSYYYDDAYGYEDYEPEDDEESDEEDQTSGF